MSGIVTAALIIIALGAFVGAISNAWNHWGLKLPSSPPIPTAARTGAIAGALVTLIVVIIIAGVVLAVSFLPGVGV